MEEKSVICGCCGTFQKIENFKEAEIYFPNRMIYQVDACAPTRCTNCCQWHDMVVFGEQVIGGLNMNLLKLETVKENNRLYKQKLEQFKKQNNG